MSASTERVNEQTACLNSIADSLETIARRDTDLGSLIRGMEALTERIERLEARTPPETSYSVKAGGSGW